jgi:hypothetical protein
LHVHPGGRALLFPDDYGKNCMSTRVAERFYSGYLW